MLVNVKFFKKTFLISFFLFLTTSLLSSEKDQIVAQLNSLNSLEFTFDQLTLILLTALFLKVYLYIKYLRMEILK